MSLDVYKCWKCGKEIQQKDEPRKTGYFAKNVLKPTETNIKIWFRNM